MISNFNEMNKNMLDMGIVNNKEEESMLNGLEDDTNYEGYDNANNDSVFVSNIESGVN